MRLSEAIRLGSMLGPQIFGRGTDDQNGSCAYGAAYLAIGGRVNDHVSVTDTWPWIDTMTDVCPVCERVPSDIPVGCGQLIPHLNDVHLWSRERIADFVASIEPQESSNPTGEQPMDNEQPVVDAPAENTPAETTATEQPANEGDTVSAAVGDQDHVQA